MDDTYQRNLQALRTKDKSLYDKILNLSDKDISIAQSKTGLPVLIIREGKNSIPLDSIDDPVNSVQERINSLKSAEINRWVIAGLGSGYRLLEAMRAAQENSQFLIVEFNLNCIKHIFSFIDLSEMIKRDLLWIYWDLKKDFIDIYERYFDRKNYMGLGILLEESNSAARMEKHRGIVDIIMYHSRKFKIDLENTERSFWLVLRNQLLNLPNILKGKKVKSLFGKFSGVPGIIISAGPSLDKNLHVLKGVRDRAVLIAVDTAVRSLLKNGVNPHLILSADPLVKNCFHFPDMDMTGSNLVFEPRVNKRIPDKFKGDIFISSFDNPFMKFLESIIGDFGKLETWGSVSTMAFDLAVKMECEPIIFLGQDLAYSRNRQHCRDSYFEEKTRRMNLLEKGEVGDESLERIIKAKKLVKTEDIFGYEIFTEEMLLNYSLWISDRIKKVGIRCINSTEGGILKDNVEIKTLSEIIADELITDFDIEKRIASAKDVLIDDCEKLVLSELQNIKKGLEEISILCERAMDISRPLKNDSNRYPEYGMSIEMIRREIMQKVVEDPYLEFLKEANEKTFFDFKQNINRGGLDNDSIFDMFEGLFKETKRKSELIIKYLDDYHLMDKVG